jgi:hypothetical protein
MSRPHTLCWPRDQIRRSFGSIGSAANEPILNFDSLTLDPIKLPQPPSQSCDASLSLRVRSCQTQEHADAPHAVGPLRARRERPRRSRAAETSDEFAPSNAKSHLPLPSPIGALSEAE